MRLKETGLEIAVVGLAGKFPGARNVSEFWNNLVAGKECIDFLSEDDLKGVDEGIKQHPNYVNAKGGQVIDKECFDESFFGYTPNEAKLMDPQVRLMHELAWEALEDAGYCSTNYAGKIALFGGAAQNLKWQAMAFQSSEGQSQGEFSSSLLANKDFICTRISYKLNLKGPSVYVSSACSTSLVAVHLACRALLSGECSLAMAGGISISASKRNGYIYQAGMINSADGHCRSFDAQSTGTIGGEGGGIVVLKILEEARRDGDNIYAVIKGSAVNNDGSLKVGFTAPSVDSQSQVIKAALKFADVEPESISYVETHGSGTALGDPIEIEALKKAFNSNKKNFCGIGAVKSNIGHLDAGAGISSFIKTVLALKHQQIPASLHFEKPNPKIDFANSPFYVNTKLQAWKKNGTPRRAGVSSFGIGGTNVHVVVEEFENQPIKESPDVPRLFVLSAKTSDALDISTKDLGKAISHGAINLEDVSYTLQVGRKGFEYRRAIIASGKDELVEVLNTLDPKKTQTFYAQDNAKDLIFMFPGIGSQYVNMARNLYESEPAFAEHINACLDTLKDLTTIDFKEILFPANSKDILPENDFEKSQLLTFVIEYSLAKLLIDWGLKPTGVIGYSFGEYVAACLSGVFSLEDALQIIFKRGVLVKKIQVGEMLSVPLSEEKVKPYLNNNLSITISNGLSTIVAGTSESIDELLGDLRKNGLLCMKVNTQYPLHSHMAASILEDFRKILQKVTINKPKIPMMLNLTGDWANGEDVSSVDYWVNHLVHTVKFGDSLKNLLKSQHAVFLEIGAGRSLSNMVRQLPERKMTHLFVQTLPALGEGSDDYRYFLNRIGQLWIYNQPIDWVKINKGKRARRISLPTYPFQKNKHWLTETVQTTSVSNKTAGRLPKIEDWFYTATWRRSASIDQNSTRSSAEIVMCFVDTNSEPTMRIREVLSSRSEFITVYKSDEFKKIHEKAYAIDPRQSDQYVALFNDLASRKLLPSRIYHCWNLANHSATDIDGDSIEKYLYDGLYSILFLLKGLVPHNPKQLVFKIAASNIFQVTGEETIDLSKTMLIGALPVIQQEFSFINCSIIDADVTSWNDSVFVNELSQDSNDLYIAHRGKFRWVQDYQSIKLNQPKDESNLFRQEGVYLLTGGLGKIGLTIATYLAKSFRAKIVLVGKSSFPAEKDWNDYMNLSEADGLIKEKIAQLKEILEAGSELLICQGNVSDYAAMEEIKNTAIAKFGSIHGVVHAAGVVKGKSIQCPILETTVKECIDQFTPKVKGTLVLNKLFNDYPLDFILCTSSLSPILGGLGFFGYASSSSFLDSFVGSNSNSKWIGVNWADWKFSDDKTTDTTDYTINRIEGLETFKRIIDNRHLKQVVVSAGSLQDRIKQWVNLELVRSFADSNESKHKQARPTLLNEYVEASNFYEKQIAALWADFFGYDKVGIHDNFFELGGDSLKALVVLSRTHKLLGEVIPLGEFFKEATVENVVRLMKQGNEKPVALKYSEKKEYYPLSSAQRRLFLHQMLDPESVAYNETRIIELGESIDYAEVVKHLNDLIKRHSIFRTTIHLINDEPMQVVHDDLTIKPQVYDCAEEDIREKIIEFIQPFSLGELPLIRTQLLSIKSGRKILLMDMPHIITDGISTNIFSNEFFKLYNKQPLEPLEYSFVDFCEWEKRESKTPKIENQRRYWRERLRSMESGFFLPNESGEIVLKSNGINTSDPVLIGSINEISKRLVAFNTTYFLLMLSCLYILLFKVSKKKKLLVGTATSGRNLADIENVLGLFINIIPLYKEIDDELTFERFLQGVSLDIMKDFDNQDLRFEDLVKEISIQKHDPNSPLFNTMLVSYVGKYKTDSKIQKASKYLSDLNSSRYDFTLLLLQDDEKYSISAEYSISAFRQETVDQMINYLVAIYQQVIANPSAKIKDIRLISDDMRLRIAQKLKTKPLQREFQETAKGIEEVQFDFDFD